MLSFLNIFGSSIIFQSSSNNTAHNLRKRTIRVFYTHSFILYYMKEEEIFQNYLSQLCLILIRRGPFWTSKKSFSISKIMFQVH